MAIDIEEFEKTRKERYQKIPKIPKTKPIKIYVFDENNMKRRIIKLDDLLHLINTGEFNDENTTFYYRTAKERDWYWKRSKIYYEERMMMEKGVITYY